jgi:hypothetical protein
MLDSIKAAKPADTLPTLEKLRDNMRQLEQQIRTKEEEV